MHDVLTVEIEAHMLLRIKYGM